MEMDTIAAIATGLSNAGISIIRISGKDAIGIVDLLFRAKKKISGWNMQKAILCIMEFLRITKFFWMRFWCRLCVHQILIPGRMLWR